MTLTYTVFILLLISRDQSLPKRVYGQFMASRIDLDHIVNMAISITSWTWLWWLSLMMMVSKTMHMPGLSLLSSAARVVIQNQSYEE